MTGVTYVSDKCVSVLRFFKWQATGLHHLLEKVEFNSHLCLILCHSKVLHHGVVPNVGGIAVSVLVHHPLTAARWRGPQEACNSL